MKLPVDGCTTVYLATNANRSITFIIQISMSVAFRTPNLLVKITGRASTVKDHSPVTA